MGVVSVQGLVSISTVVQMTLFAITLPREAFDDYAVWFTGGMFVIGLGQAVGTERVIIGKRSQADGTASARVLALAVGTVQLAVAAALSNLPLAIAALGVIAYVAYDFQRLTRCFDEAPLFVRADLAVLAVQVAAVVAVWAVVGRSVWLALLWWAVGVPAWVWLAGRTGTVREGLRVLRDDARDCVPLVVDAGLAGVPLVAALALANAQAEVGVASEARLALTILGPVTVLNMSARRLIYQEVATGPLSRRFALIWAGLCVLAFATCFGLLVFTRTPLYPWIFPGFDGLTWIAILGFAVGQTAGFFLLLPAATLRAERRTMRIGAIRVLAVLVAAGVASVVAPFDREADVAWVAATAMTTYAAGLWLASALGGPVRPHTPRSADTHPDPDHDPGLDPDPDPDLDQEAHR